MRRYTREFGEDMGNQQTAISNPPAQKHEQGGGEVQYKRRNSNYNFLVSELSVGEKAVMLGRTAFRTVEGAAQRHRWTRGLWAGLAVATRSLARTAHLIFLEIVGVFFLFFAVAGGVKTYNAWHGNAPRNSIAAGCLFTALFLYFGLSSFWRARRK